MATWEEDNKELIESYMELVYTTLYPTAIINNHKPGIEYFENKIKSYEESFGIYPSPQIRLNSLNAKYINNEISLYEYIPEAEKLLNKLKLFSQAQEVLKNEKSSS